MITTNMTIQYAPNEFGDYVAAAVATDSTGADVATMSLTLDTYEGAQLMAQTLLADLEGRLETQVNISRAARRIEDDRNE